MTQYTITELASILNIHIQTLRKYEQDFGLLIPRDGNNNRFYTDKEKTIFENIIKLKAEGLGSKAINKMLGRSVDVTEQREQALEIVSIDKLTGQDFQILFKKALGDALTEQELRLKKEFEDKIENLKYDLVEEIRKDQERLKLKEDEIQRLRTELEIEKSKGILARIFKK